MGWKIFEKISINYDHKINKFITNKMMNFSKISCIGVRLKSAGEGQRAIGNHHLILILLPHQRDQKWRDQKRGL